MTLRVAVRPPATTSPPEPVRVVPLIVMSPVVVLEVVRLAFNTIAPPWKVMGPAILVAVVMVTLELFDCSTGAGVVPVVIMPL